MLNLKIEMAPEKEEALRKRVAQYGGPVNGFLLPYLNMIADGLITLRPELIQPGAGQSKAA